MKKISWAVLIFGLVAAALYFGFRKPVFPDAVSLFPKGTIFYAGTKSPVKIAAALACVDLKSTLQNDAGLSEEESRIVSDWLRALRGVHVGFHTFTLVPFVLDAAVVLEGSFDRPLTDILGQRLSQQIRADEAYRDIPVNKMQIQIGRKFSFGIYMTDPVNDRLVIACSRQTLEDLVDRMLDGGSSLADNPQFIEMASRKEIRNADTLQYVDVQAYLNLIRDWTKTIPYPPVQPLVDLFWTELRLTDYEQFVAGFQFEQRNGSSLLQINPENPLYQQLQLGAPLLLPHVPANSSQFSFYRIADPAKAVQQIVELTVRLEQGVSQRLGTRVTQPLRAFIEQVSATADADPSEFGKLSNGEMGIWQKGAAQSGKPAMCLYLGIRDPDAVKAKIASIPELNVVETNEIYQLAKETSLAWSIQPNALLVSNNRDYLQASLSADKPSLTDSAKFSKLLKRLPSEFSMLQYVDYENGIPVQNANKLPPAFLSLLDLFKGFRQLSVSVAADGMLQSHIAQDYKPDRKLLKAAVKLLFSPTWGKSGHPMVEAEPFLLSAEEALTQSVDLLSADRQSDAEKLVANAVRKYTNDLQLLFAKAVLERSRWDKSTAKWYFKKMIQQFPNTDLARASGLSMEMDQKLLVQKLKELIALSDAHPDNVYLLWLSAIQCREQAQEKRISSESKLKVAKLGRRQYEKLLSKFTVGPVMAHHTYANILTEYLGDYEVALKHRYIAVSLEAKGWSLQGLANTLTKLKRYDEACAIWARAVQLDPLDSDYWYSGGLCLKKMKRYSEMIAFFRKAAELGNMDACCRLGYCYQEGVGVEQDYAKAFMWYMEGAKHGSSWGQRSVGWCYHNGHGVEKDIDKAIKWYQKAAELGDDCAWTALGDCYKKGLGVDQDFSKAVECYKKAVVIDPDDADNLNRCAWMLATCKDESFRDYPKAVEMAERSVELDEQNNNLDTLAVAYDRNGQFGKAVEAQKRLIAFRKKRNPDKPVPKGMQKRLKKFEEKLAKSQMTETLSK